MPEGTDRPEWEPAGGEQTERTPWESDTVSFPADLFRSWMDAMTRPGEFFRMLDPEIPFVRPLVFYLLFVVLGAGLNTVSSLAFPADETFRPYIWLIFFLSPFTGLLALLLNTGITHLGVRLFVPGAKPIHATGRVMCYSAATSVLTIVPWIGWLAGGVWAIVLMIVGVRWVHGATLGRAAAAVLVPIVVITVGLTMVIFMLGIFLALAIGASV